jgi:hypothetical protein
MANIATPRPSEVQTTVSPWCLCKTEHACQRANSTGDRELENKSDGRGSLQILDRCCGRFARWARDSLNRLPAVINFAQTLVGQRAHLPPIKPPSQGESAPKHVGGEWRLPCCTIRSATALLRRIACQRLKTRANLITTTFIFLRPPHGFRWPVRMRQYRV